jgi:SulP family sulfate permease
VTAFRIQPDLDHGLEWCEELLLEHPDIQHNGRNLHLPEQLKDLWPAGGTINDLATYLERCQVEAGQALIRQEEASECLYFIESGRVTARLELDGTRHLRLRTMGPGTVVGEVGLFLGGKRTASVIAETECTAYRLDRSALDRMRTEKPELALALHQFLIRLLAERLTTTSNMLRGMQH